MRLDMKTLSHLFLGVAAAFIMLPACGGGGTGPYDGGNGDDGGNGGNGGNGSGSVAATVTMDDVAYIDPDGNRNTEASVTIQVGETVRWVNNDDVSHTVDSGEGTGGSEGDGIPDGASAINSPTLNPGDDFEFTFNTAGTWTYYCEIHPGTMYEATVIVQE